MSIIIDEDGIMHKVLTKNELVDMFEKMKAEFISKYPKNYAGELELGGASCTFSLNSVLKVLDKYEGEIK